MSAAAMQLVMRLPSAPVRLPRPVVDSMFRLRRYASGLRPRAVRVGRFELPYLEGGSGEPIVLLHGFGDSKDSFVDCAASSPRTTG